MNVAHLLRKYDPSEWGGTETAVLRLANGLRAAGVESTIWCPETGKALPRDPFLEAGHRVRRFRSFLPVARISAAQRRQLVTIGGNLMSFDLWWRLWRTPRLSVVHSHVLNRLAGVGLFVARRRGLPFVVTIHGGVFDLSAEAHAELTRPLDGGFEWGRVFGLVLQSRRVLERADAVLTCNPREAELLAARHPRQRVIVQPHSVPTAVYAPDRRAAALAAFPRLAGRTVLLTVARIDPVKNQAWLVDQLAALRARFPGLLLVLAGAATHADYAAGLQRQIARLGLEDHVLLTGGLEPAGETLIGLLQLARALVLPSTNETFGLVILEAWAAGTAVISSRTSGAASLVRPGENGWLFAIGDGGGCQAAIAEALAQPARAAACAAAGRQLARTEYDEQVLAARVRRLYDTLVGEKARR